LQLKTKVQVINIFGEIFKGEIHKHVACFKIDSKAVCMFAWGDSSASVDCHKVCLKETLSSEYDKCCYYRCIFESFIPRSKILTTMG